MNDNWIPIENFPTPTYEWEGEPDDKPLKPDSSFWEGYSIYNNEAIVVDESGFRTFAYEWFGRWFYLVNDEGHCYSEEIVPIYYQLMPTFEMEKNNE